MKVPVFLEAIKIAFQIRIQSKFLKIVVHILLKLRLQAVAAEPTKNQQRIQSVRSIEITPIIAGPLGFSELQAGQREEVFRKEHIRWTLSNAFAAETINVCKWFLPVKPKKALHSIIVLRCRILLSELFKLQVHRRVKICPQEIRPKPEQRIHFLRSTKKMLVSCQHEDENKSFKKSK